MGSQIDLQKRNYLNKLPQGCLIGCSLLMNSFCKAEVGHNILIAALSKILQRQSLPVHVTKWWKPIYYDIQVLNMWPIYAPLIQIQWKSLNLGPTHLTTKCCQNKQVLLQKKITTSLLKSGHRCCLIMLLGFTLHVPTFSYGGRFY